MTTDHELKTGRQGNLVIHRYVGKENGVGYLAWFFCPGCEEPHAFEVPRWTFNGNYQNPTFSPSLLCRLPVKVCHLFLRDGKLRFHSDCRHSLAGQTVPLPEPPEWL